MKNGLHIGEGTISQAMFDDDPDQHVRQIHTLLESPNVSVLTMGSIEAWFVEESEAFLNGIASLLLSVMTEGEVTLRGDVIITGTGDENGFPSGLSDALLETLVEACGELGEALLAEAAKEAGGGTA